MKFENMERKQLQQFANASTITDTSDGIAVESRNSRWRDYYAAKKEKLNEQFNKQRFVPLMKSRPCM